MFFKTVVFTSLLIFVINVSTQDFGFPEAAEEDPAKRNSKQKVPIYLPNKCAENELLYPGDQGDDWVCDCYPAYVYVPSSNQCHAVYTKGPCDNGQYLVLPKNSSIPTCIPNPCSTNQVKFRGRCERLKATLPCRNLRSPKPYVVGVNETTLEVACVPEDRGNIPISEPVTTIRFGDEQDTIEVVEVSDNELDAAFAVPFAVKCAKGSHYSQKNQC